ncbi:uncharacterized protein LOC107858107 [Capsicum annuum]|uniref:uncharacterized protein LOC107858107 n=1 Tax=Capsicum annuum TaxID=4072 RepID=UPI001FB10FE9|nr:uncharacterized protein LOC107858107 [Capsicum annuum]
MASKIDPSDPLFIGTSDSFNAVLIPTKLTGSKNYNLWSRPMRIALLGTRKFDFVTRSCNKESYREKLHEQWKTFWEDLKGRFDKVNVCISINCIVKSIRCLKFLSGLNESCDKGRRQILLKGVTPTINQAYAMLIEDEIQHSSCMLAIRDRSEPLAMQDLFSGKVKGIGR